MAGCCAWTALAFVFRLIFLIGAALTALFMVDQEPEGQQGEFYALMLVATLGMNLMASSADLIMLYLAIETTSLPLYVMAGFMTRDPKSTEAGIKYFLFGAMTSAVMLYGFSLLYGFSGTTNLYAMAETVQQYPNGRHAGLPLLLVLVGFGFKVSAVPFHFWAPDVYEGAPTPVAGFLSTASKAAGFAVLMRVMMAVFPNHCGSSWTTAGGHPGSRQHDRWEYAGGGAEEYQAPAGLFVDCPGRIHPGRRGGWKRSWGIPAPLITCSPTW